MKKNLKYILGLYKKKYVTDKRNFWIKHLTLFTYFFATIIKIDFLNIFVIPILLMSNFITVVTVITVNTKTFTAMFAQWNYCR